MDGSIAARAANFVNSAVEYGWDGSITEHFRTTEQQTELFNNPPPGTPLVAEPGTSPHEAGFALDLEFLSVGPEAQQALLRAADECGFSRFDPVGEPWHFFAGTYGPYGSKAGAIAHNQQMVRDYGGSDNIPRCSQ